MKVHERIRSYVKSNGMKFSFIATKAGIKDKRFYRLMDGSAPLLVDEYETVCRDGLNLNPGYFFNEFFLEVKTYSAPTPQKS